MRMLIILTGAANSQAYVLPEFDGLIEAYYLFRDAGLEVVVAAADGGSASGPLQTTSERFRIDREARDIMNDLLDLASVCVGDFDAALCVGPQDEGADALVALLLAACKPVAVVARLPANEPANPGNGLLIIGNSEKAPQLAAKALLGALAVA